MGATIRNHLMSYNNNCILDLWYLLVTVILSVLADKMDLSLLVFDAYSMSRNFEHSRSLVSSHHLYPQRLCWTVSLNLLILMHELSLTSSEHPLPLVKYVFARQSHLNTDSAIYHAMRVFPILRVLFDCYHLWSDVNLTSLTLIFWWAVFFRAFAPVSLILETRDKISYCYVTVDMDHCISSLSTKKKSPLWLLSSTNCLQVLSEHHDLPITSKNVLNQKRKSSLAGCFEWVLHLRSLIKPWVCFKKLIYRLLTGALWA